ncbi:MAG: flippase [Thermoleophilia bacterium]|nr:flippase [Thermoleophilia bacterium]
MPRGTSSGAESAATDSYLPHIAHGAAVNYAGIIARMVFLYGYTYLLARMLPVAELGTFFLIFSMISLLGLASLAGLDHGVVRYVALYAGEGKPGLAWRTVKVALIFGLPVASLVTVGLIVMAPQAGEHFFDGSAEAVSALRIFAFAIPLLVAARMFNAATQGMHRMKYQVLSRDFGEQIAKIGLSAGALVFGLGLAGVIWANLASVAVAAALSLIFALMVLAGPAKHSRSEITGDRPMAAILRYSYPLAFSAVMAAMMLTISTLLLGLLGTSEDVGFYGVALRISLFGTKIVAAFITVFAPVIAHLWNQRKTEELEGLYVTVGRWIFILTFPIFLIIILFADSLMLIFGEGFVAGSNALIILATGQFLAALTGAAGLMVLMTGRSKLELLNIAVALSTVIGLCLLLIPRYGVAGAAMAHLSALGIVNLLRVVEIWILMRMHAYNLGYLKPLLAGGIAAVLAGLAGRFVIPEEGLVQVAVLASLFLLVYVFSMGVLGLNEQDKDLLRRIKASAAQYRAA